jgi:hypothetical protein
MKGMLNMSLQPGLVNDVVQAPPAEQGITQPSNTSGSPRGYSRGADTDLRLTDAYGAGENPVCCTRCNRALTTDSAEVLSDRVIRCLKCGTEVDAAYYRHVRNLRPGAVIASLQLVAEPGHGKTQFVRGLIKYLFQLSNCPPHIELRDLSVRAVSEMDRRRVEKLLTDDADGTRMLPTAGREEPLQMSLTGVPQADDLTLSVKDYSGELFQSESAEDGKLDRDFYHPGNATCVLMVSPADLGKSDQKPVRLPEHNLQRICELMERRGEKPADKCLLIVITKGDKLLRNSFELPQSAEAVMMRQVDSFEPDHLRKLSADLENWCLGGKCSRYLRNLAATAKRSFKRVEYTIISATGAELEEHQLPAGARPFNLLGFLYQFQMLYRPLVLRRVAGNAVRSFLSCTRALRYSESSERCAQTAVPAGEVEIELEAGRHYLDCRDLAAIRGRILFRGQGSEQTTLEIHGAQQLQLQGSVTWKDLSLKFCQTVSLKVPRSSSLCFEFCTLGSLSAADGTTVEIQSQGVVSLRGVSMEPAGVRIVADVGQVMINACQLGQPCGAPVLQLQGNARADLRDSRLTVPAAFAGVCIKVENDGQLRMQGVQCGVSEAAGDAGSTWLLEATAIVGADRATLDLRDCSIAGFARGVQLSGTSVCELSECRLRHCGCAAKLVDQSSLKMLRGAFEHNELAVRCGADARYFVSGAQRVNNRSDCEDQRTFVVRLLHAYGRFLSLL